MDIIGDSISEPVEARGSGGGRGGTRTHQLLNTDPRASHVPGGGADELPVVSIWPEEEGRIGHAIGPTQDDEIPGYGSRRCTHQSIAS
jgi:hypothetical protein